MLSGWMFFLCLDPVLTRGCFFRCFFVSVEGPPNRGLFCYFQENTVCLSGCFFLGKKLLPLRTMIRVKKVYTWAMRSEKIREPAHLKVSTPNKINS